jgi:bacterioferritin (cytochrome b1)
MPPPRPTRRRFLGAAGAAAGTAALGACGAGSSQPGPTGTPADSVHLLDAALVVEHMTIHAYDVGLPLLSAATAPRGTVFRQHHLDHRDRLAQIIAGLGGTPTAAKDTYDIGPPPTDEAGMLSLAASLEEQATRTHYATLRRLADPGLVQALGSIMADEAQHAAVLRTVLQQDPAPAAFVSM